MIQYGTDWEIENICQRLRIFHQLQKFPRIQRTASCASCSNARAKKSRHTQSLQNTKYVFELKSSCDHRDTGVHLKEQEDSRFSALTVFCIQKVRVSARNIAIKSTVICISFRHFNSLEGDSAVGVECVDKAKISALSGLFVISAMLRH